MGGASVRPINIALLLMIVVALVLYCVCLGMPHWLKAQFTIPAPAVNPALPHTLALSTDANMGLFESCSEITIPVPQPQVVSDCKSDGAADWQWIAAGFAIYGLASAVISLLFAAMFVIVGKFRESSKLQIVVAVFTFFAATGMTVALVLYGVNRTFEVVPAPLYQYETFHVSWAFHIGITSATMFLCIAVTQVVVIGKKMGGVSLSDNYVSFVADSSSLSIGDR